MINVVYTIVLDKNNVGIVVAVIDKLVPITVLETDVPNVSDEFNASDCGVSIPVPMKFENNLTSDIVNEYEDYLVLEKLRVSGSSVN